jgi:hypothetical protein
MSVRDKEKNLIIKDGVTGATTIVEHFFEYSPFTQSSILEDLALPILYDKGVVYLNTVYKD